MRPTQFAELSAVAKTYIVAVVIAGAATIVESVYRLSAQPIGWDWTVLALLTLVSGSATVRLPSLPATLSVSETFVFTSTLLFGPAPGTLTVALDALVISIWSYRKRQPLFKTVFNVCALPLTIWVASHAFFYFANIEPLARVRDTAPLRDWIWALAGFTIAYFSFNSWIITFAIALERGFPAFRIWRDNFVPLSLNYFGGASVAALLVSYRNAIDITYLAVIVPLLVVLYFTYSLSMGRVEDANRHLKELNRLYMSTIETLAMAIDAKDQITHGHIRRVQTYAVALAKEVGVSDTALIQAIEAAALLHDMGKLAVPEYILNKPGPLTPAEFEKMKLHSSVGADILSSIDFPYPVVPIVRHHHENWDGTGYPDGLRGTDIPIGARILSVVDCFDALTSDRPYRPRLSDKEALRVLLDRRGRMYDPLIVDVFTSVHTRITTDLSPIIEGSPLRAITEAAHAPSSLAKSTQGLDEIAASTEEMLTLFDLAQALRGQMSLADAADIISKHLRRLIPCSLCAFFVYDVERDELSVAHAAGENAALLFGVRIGLGQRLTGWVAANRQTIRNSDAILDLGEAVRALNPRPRTCLSTPLLIDQRLIGVLTLYSTSEHGFDEEHQRLIEVIARQVSPIVDSALVSDRTRASSFRDPVTGLPNVTHMRQLSESLTGQAQVAQPTALLLIDIDNLRDINRIHGRKAGDQILEAAAETVQANLRVGDLLFRYGSDELVALLLQTDEIIARQLSAAIQRAMSARSSPPKDFSVTIAVATSPTDGDSVEQLLTVARRYLKRRDNGNETRPESIH
jgi:diguanylate cyclase (GGDEF)-like protein/putative nucleotidyltransferase with HDIG domain